MRSDLRHVRVVAGTITGSRARSSRRGATRPAMPTSSREEPLPLQWGQAVARSARSDSRATHSERSSWPLYATVKGAELEEFNRPHTTRDRALSRTRSSPLSDLESQNYYSSTTAPAAAARAAGGDIIGGRVLHRRRRRSGSVAPAASGERGFTVALLEAQALGFGARPQRRQTIFGYASGQEKLESWSARPAARRMWDISIEGMSW